MITGDIPTKSYNVNNFRYVSVPRNSDMKIYCIYITPIQTLKICQLGETIDNSELSKIIIGDFNGGEI